MLQIAIAIINKWFDHVASYALLFLIITVIYESRRGST